MIAHGRGGSRCARRLPIHISLHPRCELASAAHCEPQLSFLSGRGGAPPRRSGPSDRRASQPLPPPPPPPPSAVATPPSSPPQPSAATASTTASATLCPTACRDRPRAGLPPPLPFACACAFVCACRRRRRSPLTFPPNAAELPPPAPHHRNSPDHRHRQHRTPPCLPRFHPAACKAALAAASACDCAPCRRHRPTAPLPARLPIAAAAIATAITASGS